MANSTATTQQAEINTLESEGKALSADYKSRKAKADRTMFSYKRDTADGGFDTRLGKLMQSLRLEGGERISKDRLQDCGITSIPKQRRSDAEWYVNTKADADAFNRKSKKGFTNLSALRKAMADAAKADQPEQTTESTDSEVKSDVGPKPFFGVIDATALALQLIEDCEKHNVVMQDVLDLVSASNVQKAVA